MINKEILLNYINVLMEYIKQAVLNADRDILLLVLAGLVCLFCLVRLIRIWSRRKDLVRQQESMKSRIDKVVGQS